MKRFLFPISAIAILLAAIFSPAISQNARNRVRRTPAPTPKKSPTPAKDDSGPIIYLPSQPAKPAQPVEERAAESKPPASRPAALAGWYQGAAGMEQAIQEYKRTKAPVLIYFRADWCGYCKKLEKELLPSPAVEQYLRAMIKVHIAPDDGVKESQVAKVFQVTGFPTIVVITSGGAAESGQERVTRIDPFIEGNNDKYALVSPRQFIRDCRKAAR